MENILSYEVESNTIRQLPQNYLIAHNFEGRWICDPDLACDVELAVRVFKELLNYDSKYGKGLYLLSRVTPNEEFK